MHGQPYIRQEKVHKKEEQIMERISENKVTK